MVWSSMTVAELQLDTKGTCSLGACFDVVYMLRTVLTLKLSNVDQRSQAFDDASNALDFVSLWVAWTVVHYKHIIHE